MKYILILFLLIFSSNTFAANQCSEIFTQKLTSSVNSGPANTTLADITSLNTMFTAINLFNGKHNYKFNDKEFELLFEVLEAGIKTSSLEELQRSLNFASSYGKQSPESLKKEISKKLQDILNELQTHTKPAARSNDKSAEKAETMTSEQIRDAIQQITDIILHSGATLKPNSLETLMELVIANTETKLYTATRVFLVLDANRHSLENPLGAKFINTLLEKIKSNGKPENINKFMYQMSKVTDVPREFLSAIQNNVISLTKLGKSISLKTQYSILRFLAHRKFSPFKDFLEALEGHFVSVVNKVVTESFEKPDAKIDAQKIIYIYFKFSRNFSYHKPSNSFFEAWSTFEGLFIREFNETQRAMLETATENFSSKASGY